jgi:hypothetical protein
MKLKKRIFVLLPWLVLGMCVQISCTIAGAENSTETTVPRATQEPIHLDSIELTQNASATSIAMIVEISATPTVASSSVNIEEENEEGAVSTTVTPSPTIPTIDITSLEWKIAIPSVTDSCQFTIADSTGYSFFVEGETPSGDSISCLASWRHDGEQLATTRNNSIEIIDLHSNERIFLMNPFLVQITPEEYSILDIGHNDWSEDNHWLHVLARNRFEIKPLEIFQTIIFDTVLQDSVVFEENIIFKAWSPVNENTFAYISLESGGGNIPGVYNIGLWDLALSQPIAVIKGLSENYNILNSQLVLSPDGNYAVLDVLEKDTAENIIIMIDFQQSIWSILSDNPVGLIPWSWSPSGNWIGFYNSDGIYFLNNWISGSSTISSQIINDGIPIGWLPEEDIFVYERNQKIYVLDPNYDSSSTLLLDLAEIEANIDPYTPIAFWVDRIGD